MKNSRFTSQLAALLLIGVIAASPAAPNDPDVNANRLRFTSHADGTFSVTAKEIPLAVLLTKVRETTSIAIYIDKANNRPVSIDASNVTLVQLARRIAGDNYAIIFDGSGVEALHILHQGQSNASRTAHLDFAGQIKISNQRARMFFMPADNSKEAVDSYIKKRHEALSRIAREEPHKQLHAQVSFQGYMSGDQILEFVKNNRLDPATLNIGWKENGGGYDLKQNESIDAAIASAAMHHERFIEQIREDADMQVESLRQQGITDNQMKSELAFQENAHELNSVYLRKGVPFYGIRISASAKQLNSLVGKDHEVRLVDPLWGGSVESEIANVYPTTKIAIPLIPVNEVFVP